MQQNIRMAAIVLLGPVLASAARLTQPAKGAFESYVTKLEARLTTQRESTCIASLPGEGGGGRVDPVNGGSWDIAGGMLHHWRAATFVPGAGPQNMLDLLHDYDRLSRYYAPDVVYFRSPATDGRMVIRFRKRVVITIVLDAEFQTESGLAPDGCGFSFSRSTHIWQVDQPGSPQERHRAEGADDGFLWRLNSYWSFKQKDGGLLIECEAVSLTRDVPPGLGWLLAPIIQTLPRDALEFTMQGARNALTAYSTRRHADARAN